MPKREFGFKHTESKNGEFSPRITKENNRYLDIYCSINGLNKTIFVNDLIKEKMTEIFQKLKEGDNIL